MTSLNSYILLRIGCFMYMHAYMYSRKVTACISQSCRNPILPFVRCSNISQSQNISQFQNISHKCEKFSHFKFSQNYLKIVTNLVLIYISHIRIISHIINSHFHLNFHPKITNATNDTNATNATNATPNNRF